MLPLQERWRLLPLNHWTRVHKRFQGCLVCCCPAVASNLTHRLPLVHCLDLVCLHNLKIQQLILRLQLQVLVLQQWYLVLHLDYLAHPSLVNFEHLAHLSNCRLHLIRVLTHRLLLLWLHLLYQLFACFHPFQQLIDRMALGLAELSQLHQLLGQGWFLLCFQVKRFWNWLNFRKEFLLQWFELCLVVWFLFVKDLVTVFLGFSGFSLSGLEFRVEIVDFGLKLLFVLSKFVEIGLEGFELVLVDLLIILKFYGDSFQLMNFVFLWMI